MLRRVALVRTDVSEELSASFIRMTRIGELGTTLATTSSVRRLLVTASVVPSSQQPTLAVGRPSVRNLRTGNDVSSGLILLVPLTCGWKQSLFL
jgi:hypothetical protein